MKLTRSSLHKYQERAITFIKDVKKCALFIEMGLGKTVSVLTALTDIMDSMLAVRVLVIAPLRVANTVWKQEAQRWAQTKHLRVEVCTGTAARRLMHLMKDADIHVINVDVLPWFVATFIDKWRWDVLVIDESSMFKNADTLRFRTIKKVRSRFKYVIELTGTPTPNSMSEIWPQMFIIDGGQRLGKTFSGFQAMYFNKTDYLGYKYELKRGALAVIHNRISDCVMSLQAKDYLELPDRVNMSVEIELPGTTMRQYKELYKESLLQLEGNDEVTAMNAAVMANKLLQICNGAIYVNDSKDYRELHREKLDALEELIEENGGENILVAYAYKHDLERLMKRFRQAVAMDKKAETIAAWNRGEIPLLLAHPMSAGHGLNLQFGGSMIIWFSMTWSLEQYLQFNARLHRQGQEKPVRVIHIVAKDTIDLEIMDILTRKDANQKMLLECFKIKV